MVKKDQKQSLTVTILQTGLLVGTLDLLAAMMSQYVKTGLFAEKMLLYIAGGFLGLEKSMAGGYEVEMLGLFFHYFIATSFTVLFFLLYPRWKILSRNVYLIGMLYSAFVSLFMRLCVLPLTQLPSLPFILSRAFTDWMILGLALGIPISFFASQFYKENK
ncbi:MAG TPA: hypothetical protein PLY70_01955 [Saprospiraceae bacterium]|nr:hypothetical protein [Saprospiraceae bacterium]HPN68634.1 hypothetical protein [Saprospiraceae bacterium]